jgi:Holliday junction resolvase
VAKRFGASLHNGSGSGSKRHDMHTDEQLIECKTVLRGNKQITIHADDLRSLKYHAAVADVAPVMHIELDKERWVMVPESDYEGPVR